MVHRFTSQRLLLRSTLSHNSNDSPNGNSSRTETEHLLFSLSLSACMLMFASVMTLHTHIFACRHSQFISLSLGQHHGGCCFLPDGEMRAIAWEVLSGMRMLASWKLSQWCSSFGDSKLGAKEQEGKWRRCFQSAARTRIHKSLLGQIFLTDQMCPSSEERNTDNE